MHVSIARLANVRRTNKSSRTVERKAARCLQDTRGVHKSPKLSQLFYTTFFSLTVALKLATGRVLTVFFAVPTNLGADAATSGVRFSKAS